MPNQPAFRFFALAAVGEGLSGGDRIFIEFAKQWASLGYPIHIYVWEEGAGIIAHQHLAHNLVHIHVLKLSTWSRFGFFVNYIARIFAGVWLGLTLKVEPKDFLYSCSDFWMDVFPAAILKFRFPKTHWFGGWFQTAPNPFRGYTEGKRKHTYKLASLLYWLSQFIAKPLLAHSANLVLVNNSLETSKFPKSLAVLGAVDVSAIKKFRTTNQKKQKVYDAIFQGRFHPQKGVLELIDIWASVVKTKPSAKLIMIGDGELMPQVVHRIDELNLNANIILKGYIYDGPEKYSIFNTSRVVVHPAYYDSGGMASAEAMAFGLPCVGFDLPAYKSYYPMGMLKVPIGDINQFAETITNLLTNKTLYAAVSTQAEKLISTNYSWEKRAKEVLTKVLELCQKS